MIQIKKTASLIALFFVALSCTKERAPLNDCINEISFSQDISPMISFNCSVAGCHDASASGGYIFENYDQISSNASIILSVIRHDDGVNPMPLGASKLPDSVIQQFTCWMNQGKKDN